MTRRWPADGPQINYQIGACPADGRYGAVKNRSWAAGAGQPRQVKMGWGRPGQNFHKGNNGWSRFLFIFIYKLIKTMRFFARYFLGGFQVFFFSTPTSRTEMGPVQLGFPVMQPLLMETHFLTTTAWFRLGKWLGKAIADSTSASTREANLRSLYLESNMVMAMGPWAKKTQTEVRQKGLEHA